MQSTAQSLHASLSNGKQLEVFSQEMLLKITPMKPLSRLIAKELDTLMTSTSNLTITRLEEKKSPDFNLAVAMANRQQNQLTYSTTNNLLTLALTLCPKTITFPLRSLFQLTRVPFHTPLTLTNSRSSTLKRCITWRTSTNVP